MKRTTSIHNLNADEGLGFFEKIAYLILNLVNNLFPYSNVDKRIVFKTFSALDWRSHWNETYPTSSAARKLSDLFWRSLPWQEIPEELGGVRIFDTGCGHGNYSLRLWAGIEKYTGIDAKRRENWKVLEEEHPNIKFIESRSSDILPQIPEDTNFFMSQSAIEHFDEDLRFFEQIRDFVSSNGKPVMQVHLFPAAATLPLYLFHGLRQYTPRTISKITRLFSNNSKFYLFGLGGRECGRLHWKYFTWPVLIRRKFMKATFDVSVYEPELKSAIERDLMSDQRSPIFWALIIHSNPKSEIW